MRNLGILLALIAALAAGLVTAGVRPATGQSETPEHRVLICHDVEGNGNTGNGFNLIEVDKDSIANIPNGHDTHEGDIIPPFAAGATEGPPGPPKSWDAYPGKGDFSLIETNCAEPVTTTTTTDTTTTTTTPRGVATAGAICITALGHYRVVGTIDGNPATVSPETIPGNKSGPTLVTVTLGSDSQVVIVNTAGDCVQGDEPPPTTTTTTTTTTGETTVQTTTTTTGTTGGETTTAPGETTTTTTTSPPETQPTATTETTSTVPSPQPKPKPKPKTPPKPKGVPPSAPPPCPATGTFEGRCAPMGSG